jgi:hypothetical protein
MAARTVIERVAQLAAELLGLRPRPALVPVPVRSRRPARTPGARQR